MVPLGGKVTAPRARTLRRRLIGGPASWGDTAGVPTPQAPLSTQAASPQARRPPGRHALPRVGFPICPPHPVLLSPACPCPSSRAARVAPTSCTGTHTAWPGAPGTPRASVSFAASRPLAHGPVPPPLLFPLTPSVFMEVPLPPPCPACLRSCLLPSPSRTGALGPQGTWRPAAASPPRAENCPAGRGQRPALTAPCLRLPGRAGVSSPSVAVRGQGPTAPPVHRPPRALVLNPHLQGVSPLPPPCTKLLQARGGAPGGRVPSGHVWGPGARRAGWLL